MSNHDHKETIGFLQKEISLTQSGLVILKAQNGVTKAIELAEEKIKSLQAVLRYHKEREAYASNAIKTDNPDIYSVTIKSDFSQFDNDQHITREISITGDDSNRAITAMGILTSSACVLSEAMKSMMKEVPTSAVISYPIIMIETGNGLIKEMLKSKEEEGK